MKLVRLIFLSIISGGLALAAGTSVVKGRGAKIAGTAKATAAGVSTNAVASKVTRRKMLEKTPKSLFLIKKIKISPDVGEPQFSPEQAQLRTVINDPVLHNYKKFE